jgi:hypothetical protein
MKRTKEEIIDYFLQSDFKELDRKDLLGCLFEEYANQHMDLKVSMLRQWLNESRITDPKKMVTNANIRYWLGIDKRHQ